VIALDAALAAGQTERAQRLVQALEADSNADVNSRREQLKALRSSTMSRSYELPLPLVNCFSAGDVPGCEIWPGQEAPDPAYKVAHEAYQAYSDGQYALAAEKAAAAMQLNPDIYPTASFACRHCWLRAKRHRRLRRPIKHCSFSPMQPKCWPCAVVCATSRA
jgi:hypothetical protein